MHSPKIDIPTSPVTQELAAGMALARYLGIDEALPERIPLFGGSQLTLSSKKDVYYMTTLKACSCPAGQYHKICKHQRDACQAFRGQQKAVVEA